MKSIVLYALDPSSNRAGCGPCGKCDGYTKVKVSGGPDIFVRAVVASGDGLRTIMNSKPRKGEVILNSVEL